MWEVLSSNLTLDINWIDNLNINNCDFNCNLPNIDESIWLNVDNVEDGKLNLTLTTEVGGELESKDSYLDDLNLVEEKMEEAFNNKDYLVKAWYSGLEDCKQWERCVPKTSSFWDLVIIVLASIVILFKKIWNLFSPSGTKD